ncbi:hypothetical protein OAV68_02390, partial [bacterium]|nr:hypothetical protein [bacterium]
MELTSVFENQSIKWNSIVKVAASIEWADWENNGKESNSLITIFQKNTHQLVRISEQLSIDIDIIVKNAVAIAPIEKMQIAALTVAQLLAEKKLKNDPKKWRAVFPKLTPFEKFLSQFINDQFVPKPSVFRELLRAAYKTDAETNCILNLLLSSGGFPKNSSLLFSTLKRYPEIKSYAEKLIAQQRTMVGSERSDRFLVDDLKLLERQKDGLNAFFGTKEMSDITTPLMREYFNVLDQNRETPLAATTKNKHGVVIRKVLKVAAEEGVIPSIPLIPKFSIKDNPRVTFTETEYKKFLQGIKRVALKGDVIRGNRLTDEFYYFTLFIVHSYLRPIKTEAFGLKHHDI